MLAIIYICFPPSLPPFVLPLHCFLPSPADPSRDTLPEDHWDRLCHHLPRLSHRHHPHLPLPQVNMAMYLACNITVFPTSQPFSTLPLYTFPYSALPYLYPLHTLTHAPSSPHPPSHTCTSHTLNPHLTPSLSYFPHPQPSSHTLPLILPTPSAFTLTPSLSYFPHPQPSHSHPPSPSRTSPQVPMEHEELHPRQPLCLSLCSTADLHCGRGASWQCGESKFHTSVT